MKKYHRFSPHRFHHEFSMFFHAKVAAADRLMLKDEVPWGGQQAATILEVGHDSSTKKNKSAKFGKSYDDIYTVDIYTVDIYTYMCG